ncbi:substrate-binding periplasmic protein [Roseibium sp. SCP14]|uniref:substrate-binding periplasmic protein n=1 Tax=Roseibium sp. SCP14 TaxID=3141375 RepID=UPI00333AC628
MTATGFNFALRSVQAALFCLSLLLVQSQAAFATPDQIIITGFEAPPYFYTDQTGNPTGLLVELVQEASRKSGVSVKFAVTNWPRAQLETRNGGADLIFPVVRTPERESWLEYPLAPITRFEMMIFSNGNPEFSFTGNADELHGLRIGKIAKGRMHPKFRALEESGKALVEPRDNVDQLITAVHHGRIDAFVAPRLMTLWTIDKMGIEDVHPFATPMGVSNIYLALSKKSKKRLAWEKLSKALPNLEIRKSRFLAALADR